MMRGCSTILPKNFSLCFVCHSNSFLPAQLSKACQWSVSAHFKILQGRLPAGKVFPSKQFLIMILKLVIDRKCLCVLDISVGFRITHVCEIMCIRVCFIAIGEIEIIILVHQDLHLHLVCTYTLFAPAPCLQLHLVCTCPLFAPCLHLHLACKKLHKLSEPSFPSSSLFSPLTAWCFLLFSCLLEMRWRRILLSLQWVFCLRCISISSLFTVQGLSVLYRSLAFWVSANLCVSFLSISPDF